VKGFFYLLKQYVAKTDLEKFAKDMNFSLEGFGNQEYAERKFIEMRRDIATFHNEISSEFKEKLYKALLNQAPLINYNYEFELEEALLTIRVEYEYEYESDYGADADGNRGVPLWTASMTNWDAFDEDSNTVSHLLWPSLMKEIEEQIETNQQDALQAYIEEERERR